MMQLVATLRDTPRLLIGRGLRRAVFAVLEYVRHACPGVVIRTQEFPSGQQVGDWRIPESWKVTVGKLEDRGGHIWASYEHDPLELVGYSASVEGWFDLEDIPIYTAAAGVPHVSAAYADSPTWGFCMSETTRAAMPIGQYHVHIDSERLEDSLTVGEAVFPDGTTDEEILFTSYLCHPAGLMNNETSGPVVLAELARWIGSEPRRYRYRFIFSAETIGAVALLNTPRELDRLQTRTKAIFVATCLCGPGKFQIGRGPSPNFASRIAESLGIGETVGWQGRISDERQYGSAGFPVACISKTRPPFHGYHTNADTVTAYTAQELEESLELFRQLVQGIEADRNWEKTCIGEPMLSKRGLYDAVSRVGSSSTGKALLDVWSLCRDTSSLEISEQLEQPLLEVQKALGVLERHGLIQETT